MMKIMLIGGGGLLGYLYLKKHPEKLQMMRKMESEACKKIGNTKEIQ